MRACVRACMMCELLRERKRALTCVHECARVCKF